MARLLQEDELEGALDCFGQFDPSEEMCMKHCGLNISCASYDFEEDEFDWLEEEGLRLPDINQD